MAFLKQGPFYERQSQTSDEVADLFRVASYRMHMHALTASSSSADQHFGEVLQLPRATTCETKIACNDSIGRCF